MDTSQSTLSINVTRYMGIILMLYKLFFVWTMSRLKDGMVAAEQCSRYHVDGYSLVIRDVAEEDAGVYTILTRIQQFDLHQNLTLSLVVKCKLVCNNQNFPCCLMGLLLASASYALRSELKVCVFLSPLTVKPQIGEKALAVQDTATMPRFSRQVFRCTAHGVPRPQIQWLWNRCPSKGL